MTAATPRRLAALLGAVVLALCAPGGTASAAPAADEGPADVVTIVRSDPGKSGSNNPLATYLRLMAIPSVDTGHVPVIRPPGVDGRKACPPARCRDHRVPLPAGVKVSSNVVRVVLPKGYHAAKARKRRYPVVYLYNGARSPYTRWSVATELISVAKPLPAILVMPEGGIGEDAGMFSDWKDGSYQWETFHTTVLTRWVDRRFRTTRKRAAVGASMGGLGALAYPARHPGMFQAAFSLSGAVDTNQMVANILPPELAKALGISPPNLLRVWGDPVLEKATWDAHNPTALASRLRGVKVLVASGTGSASTESATTDPLHTGYTEQLMWFGHRTLLLSLTEARVPYRAWVRQGGVHNWPWFDAPLKWGLPKVVAALR